MHILECVLLLVKQTFSLQGNSHLTHFEQLKFLVLDEADRMVERGHFVELRDILHKVNGQPLSDGRRRQKLVFSATLTLPKKRRKRGKKIRHQEEGLGKCLSKVYISPCSRFTTTVHLYSLSVCV